MNQAIIDRAREIARDVTTGADLPPVIATRSARQGDLVLTAIGPVPDHIRPLEAAALLAEGSHGGHVALGRLLRDGELLHVGTGGATVVHTDEPAARHRAVHLTPGTWRITGLRELDLDLIIRRVQD